MTLDIKAQLSQRFDKPHYRLLRQVGLFEPLQRANRWMYRIKSERRALRGEGLVPEDRLRDCYGAALRRLRELSGDEPLGDYLEFGVAFGSSMACMHEALVRSGEKSVRLFGFDSFEGLPPEADEEREHGWFSGQLQATLPFAQKLLTRRGVDWNRTFLIKGWFKDTLTPELVARHQIKRAGVIMIDSDLYSSASEALAFCEPLIGRHAVILFDEWNSYKLAERNLGERRAFEEFLARNPDLSAEPMPSYWRSSAVFLLTRR
ncbi:TylF/MycF/NovP-related O-methyltransferase [Arenibaculum pallidiluteum]|uniref:TylF/MycF/NovP-related O-methyltransferase n=1 Tax=Arenibaculum pallidiluteum TaxID=2812559 RepID=UPI001A9661A0|nr:TylF/MycF/NovP-related O-methyltransferase [Arenibaculum pallidiluteum]